ncbi:S8 family serine peptidase [Nitrosopumilus sp.]|uniref:S8 family serine peptidase n=1 Tax=Nitrosopumilus sp. TaxID=2024843 RepID=UPI003D0E6672
MPKAAIFFSILLLSSVMVNSYAYTGDDVQFHEKSEKIEFTSQIIDVDSNFFVENNLKRYLIFGTNSQNSDYLKNNSIYGIQSDNGFFYVSLLSEKSASLLASQGIHIIEDSKLDFHLLNNEIIDASRIGDITGSKNAQLNYNASGNGTVIAIIDTGVDFSNPDIQHSLARNEINHPIMLDPDGQGIVLTNSTFFAYIDENEIIRNYSKPIPEHMTSSAYVTKEGVFLDLSQGGKGSDIQIYNSFFPQIGSFPIFKGTLDKDMKIGQDNRNYIKSKSGIYHLGVIYQGGLSGPLAKVQVVPVLVVDSFIAGVYDTIIPDLSTSWEDYTRFSLPSGQQPNYDFDFTDEKPIVLGSGNEFLVYDSNDDGKIDYSAGTIGAQVLDVYGVIGNNSTEIDDTLNAINGTLLPALDPNGEFFGIMTDFMGHGTSSAASITSRGQETYDIYNDTKKYSITGVAPNAKILPVKALWFGDTVYAWLWSAGFENNNNAWEFTGKPRVDIISNSWGISNFPSFKSAPGMDVLSLIQSILATPHSIDDDYPGVVMVSSAGNSGHGYGTIGLPNASPFGITVGATTNNVFVGYGPFKDQPRFGNDIDHYNHVVDFSSRGPTSIGDPKPDVMSIGANGFVPSNMIKTTKDSKDESFSLFGGTSMAAPLVSGSAAILIEEMTKQSQNYDPFVIKNILMSTAVDLNNDPFTQGSGLTNVNSALDYVHGKNGVFVITNENSYENLKKILEPTIENFNYTAIGFEQFKLPSHSLPMTSWFAGQLIAGDRAIATFTITNPTDDEISVDVKSKTLSLIKHTQFNGTTIPRQQDSILNKTGAFIPNYVKLSDVKPHEELKDFFDEEYPIPDDSSLMILNVNFPFNQFMNSTSDVYADDMKISSLYLYDWVDNNNDTKISSDEISLVNRGGSWGTVQEIRVSEPNEKFDGVPLVGVYPVPTRYSYWLGNTNQNSTSIDYTISANYYQNDKWSMLWSESETITVPPNDISTVDVTLVTPTDLETGVYQGFLNFQSDTHEVNAPVSFTIKEPITQNDSMIIIHGKQSDDILYGNGYTKGAFDMTNRYMAGDWRQYYFDVQNEFVNSAAIEISWTSDDTNLAVFVMDPLGKIIQTNVPSGVFGHFLGWPSLDWLGNSLFSQGGGFYPVKNKDDTSTVLYVPINQTGTYTLLTHSTLFGGNSSTEPITLAAKFTNISTEMMSQNSEIMIDDKTSSDLEKTTKNETISVKKETIVEEITTPSDDSDSLLLTGIGIGIAIGIAIGIVSIIIIRQKPTK